MAKKDSERSGVKADGDDKRSGRVSITPAPRMKEFLQILSAMGIYGKDQTGVVYTLVGLQIERLIHEGILEKPKLGPTDFQSSDD